MEKEQNLNVKKELIAKKDFHILFNKVNVFIKKGDDVSKLNLNKVLMQNLKTEKVI